VTDLKPADDCAVFPKKSSFFYYLLPVELNLFFGSFKVLSISLSKSSTFYFFFGDCLFGVGVFIIGAIISILKR